MIVGPEWRKYKLKKMRSSMKDFWDDIFVYNMAPKSIEDYKRYLAEWAWDVAENNLAEIIMYYGTNQETTLRLMLNLANRCYMPHFRWMVRPFRYMSASEIYEVWEDAITAYPQHIIEAGKADGELDFPGQEPFEDDENVIISEVLDFFYFLSKSFSRGYRTYSKFREYLDFWEAEVRKFKTRDKTRDEENLDLYVWRPDVMWRYIRDQKGDYGG